jgi:hypothetical protein
MVYQRRLIYIVNNRDFTRFSNKTIMSGTLPSAGSVDASTFERIAVCSRFVSVFVK